MFFSTGDLLPVGNVGLAVSQSLTLTMLLQMAARFTADYIGQMTAVERILEYTNLPLEQNLMDGRMFIIVFSYNRKYAIHSVNLSTYCNFISNKIYKIQY